MIKKIVRCKNPEILVITPLGIRDKISKETKKSIKRNKTPFEWISYMGDNNPAKNVQIAYKQYRRDNEGLPPYVIKMDGDITASRYMLDKMCKTLKEAESHVAYAYSPFEFKGSVNVKFSYREFDSNMIVRSNYISSCSLIKTQLLDQIGSWVVHDKYFRLLDWCLWLKFLKHGFIGKAVQNTHFVAKSTPKSISCRSREDYAEKYQHVKNDFILPLLHA